MNHDEYILLLSERTTLRELIADTPENEVIDRGSLTARLEGVERRIAAAVVDQRAPARVRLTFRGRPVVGSHGIFAEFASKAVNDFTESVVAMAASLTAPLGSRGIIPKREQHQLLITSTALGSFGFELEEHQTGQLPLDQATPVAKALERTQKLLQGTRLSDEDLADSAFEVDERALDKVRAFLQTLADNEATCTMTVGRDTVEFRDAGEVRASLGRLSRENIREEAQTLVGEMHGTMPDASAFEFRIAPSGPVIHGKIGPAIPDPHELNRRLYRRATIKVMVMQVGKGRPRYVLLEFSETPP